MKKKKLNNQVIIPTPPSLTLKASELVPQSIVASHQSDMVSFGSPWKTISEAVEEKYVSKSEFYKPIRVYYNKKVFLKEVNLPFIPTKDSILKIDGRLYKIYEDPIINIDNDSYKAIIFVDYLEFENKHFNSDEVIEKNDIYRAIENEKAFNKITFHYYYKINLGAFKDEIVNDDYLKNSEKPINILSFVFDSDLMEEKYKMACEIHDKFCRYANCNFKKEFLSHNIWDEPEHAKSLSKAISLLSENYDCNMITHILSSCSYL